jgi:RNA polymerase sigma-70 factor (ECF subfamily)
MSMPTPQPLAASPERLADIELIDRIKAGDGRAMEALMRRHNRVLYRTARAILRNDADAEDAVQDAYIKAYNAFDKFRGESKLSTWLVRIAANEALMRRRRNARLAEVVPIDGTVEDEPEPDMDKQEGPERETLRGQMRKILEARIDELPDGYRTVFMLRGVE